MPVIGSLKPTDKINIQTHIHDVEELNKKVVDPLTGRLILKNREQLMMEKEEKIRAKQFKQRFDRPDMDLSEDHEYTEEE